MSDFVLVKNKKRKLYFRRKRCEVIVDSSSVSCILSPEEIATKVCCLKEELTSSQFYKALLAVLQVTSDLESIREILCLGLGSFSSCLAARYQLALLLAIKDHLNCAVKLHDPVFNTNEIHCLKGQGCNVILINKEGKHKIENKTLVLLPHCPKQLINNFLWCNWGRGLSNCIIVGNSFSDIIESNSSKFLKDNLKYIFTIYPEVDEIKIENSFRFNDIFNNLSVHVFPEYKINNVSREIWKLDTEPVYEDNKIEFITEKIKKSLEV